MPTGLASKEIFTTVFSMPIRKAGVASSAESLILVCLVVRKIETAPEEKRQACAGWWGGGGGWDMGIAGGVSVGMREKRKQDTGAWPGLR